MRTRAVITAEFESVVAFPEPQAAPDCTLYHYTDASGLLGILERKAVRATHFLYLNDTAEVRGAETMVHDVARSILDESTLSDLERSICERFVQIYPQAALSNVSDIYVASFSRWRNDLAQWRCYAAGGSGYCIGFRAVLAARQPGGYVAAKLEQVEYRPEVLRTKTKVILRAVLSEAVNVLKRGPDDQSEVETVALQFMLRQSGALVTRLKDPAFENEAEWRLVAGLLARAPKDTVHFRSTGSGLVPFIELPLLTTKPDDLLDIESVYVGPTHDLESGLRSTKLAVARFGYDPKVVHHSGIPFRGSRW